MSNRRTRTQDQNAGTVALAKEMRQIDWKKRLKTIQDRWVPNTPENTAAFLAQVNEAWEMAYLCIWNLHGRAGMYARYTDDERAEAAIQMHTSLMKYDPKDQPLLKYVYQKSILLLKGAWARGIDIESDPPAADGSDWELELETLQLIADGSEEWVDAAFSLIHSRHASRIKAKFHEKEARDEVREDLKKRLSNCDPGTLDLKELASQWAKDVLGGEKKIPTNLGILGTSLDTPVGEEKELTLGNLLADPGPSVEDQVHDWIASWDILSAMAAKLNYDSAKNPNQTHTVEKHRRMRMCYTERVLFLAKSSDHPIPDGKFMTRAMLESYLQHFSVLPQDWNARTLPDLPFKTEEEILDPDSSPDTWATPLEWSGASDYLPAIVPKTYLIRNFNERVADSTVSEFRKTFYKECKKLVGDRYSIDDI